MEPTADTTAPAAGAGRYVHLYMEANPNPAAMKFVANFFLVPEGTDFHFESLEEAAESPLAQMLFSMPFVDKVFLMSNFVTVTKGEDYEWDDVQRLLRDAIQEYLVQGKAVLTDEALRAVEPALLTGPDGGALSPEQDTEITAQIRQVLDEYIRPAVEGDGGAINFHSFEAETGLVRVQLRGSCSGCPSSTVTLKAGIENLLRRMVPGVVTVEALA